MKKIRILFLVFSLVSVFLPKSIVAQEESSTVSLNIETVEYISQDHSLRIGYSLVNNTDQFTGDLNYVFTLYRGDQLAESGYAFDGLDMSFSLDGTIVGLKPSESKQNTIDLSLPRTLNPGNYFIRSVFTDVTSEYSDLAITESPVYLEGEGGHIGYLSAKFRIDNQDAFLMEGLLAEPDQEVVVVIPIAENPELTDYLDTNEIYYRVQLFSVNNSSEDPVHVYDTQLLDYAPTSEEIIIPLKPWESIQAGPYDVEVLLLNDSDLEIAQRIYARWLVNGFTARFNSVESGTNIYKRGDNLDLTVDLVSFTVDESPVRGEVDLLMRNEEGEEITYSKEVDLFGEKTINFSEYSFSKEFRPTEITLELMVDGELISSYNQEIPQGELFSRVNDLKENKNLYIIITVVLLLILVFITLAFSKHKRTLALLCALVIVATSFGYKNFYNVQAASQSSDATWYDAYTPNSNLGNCPQSARPRTSIKVTCGTCMNGLHGSGDIAGVGFSLPDQGHKWDVQYWGPFYGNTLTVNNSNSSNQWSKIAVVNDGVHCYGDTIGRDYHTFSCTPTFVGSCGTARDSYHLTPPTSNLCASGNAGNWPDTNPLVKENEQGLYYWSCSGSNNSVITDDVWCTTQSPEYGVCGPADGELESSAPSGSELCSVGQLANYDQTCSANNGSTNYTGTHDTLGLNNGDQRFYCFDDRFYECGWEATNDSFAHKSRDGFTVGNYSCNLGASTWVEVSEPKDYSSGVTSNADGSYEWSCVSDLPSERCSTETYQCYDDQDNDNDGLIDELDPGCVTGLDNESDLESGVSCIVNQPNEAPPYEIGEPIQVQVYATNFYDWENATINWQQGGFIDGNEQNGNTGDARSKSNSFDTAGTYPASVSITYEGVTESAQCLTSQGTNEIEVSMAPAITFDIAQSIADSQGECLAAWTITPPATPAPYSCSVVTGFSQTVSSGITNSDSEKVEAGNEYRLFCEVTNEMGAVIETVETKLSKCVDPDLMQR